MAKTMKSGWQHRILFTLGFLELCCRAVLGNNLQKNIGDYYTSQHGLRKLATVEQEVAKAVAEYVAVLEKRLEIAKRFLSDYETSGVSFNASSLAVTALTSQKNGVQSREPNSDLAYPVSAHPLRAYRLLRRFVHDLPTLEKEIRSDDERKFLKLTEKVKGKVPFPKILDMQGATEGILRVHDTYNMNIDDFTSGNFYNFPTNTSINAADCYEIGLYAFKSTIYSRAIQWLERAYRLVIYQADKSISPEEVRGKLEEAVLQHNEALLKRSKNPYLFTKPVTLDDALQGDKKVARKRVLDGGRHVLREKQSSFNDLTNFASLCGGKQLRSHSELSKLKCWFESRHPLNTLAPLKIESHNEQPKVLQFHQVISETLSQTILKAATESMSRSQVHVKTRSDNKMISATRTSTSAWLEDDRKSALGIKMDKVYSKIEAFTGLRIRQKGASELLQVSCYGIAGHFNPHLDTVFNSVQSSAIDQEERQRGDRIATIMLYLSDVIRGGSTAFPRLGLNIQPVKGSAIFWYNMIHQGEPDELSLHGGCPILYGNKCVSNKWIRFNAQTRQCPLSKED